MSEKISEAELRQRFPKASDAFIRLNARVPARSAGAPAKLERGAGDGPARQDASQKAAACRFRVRCTRIGRRLLDPDNCCFKYQIDALRRHGVIPDDSADHIDLVVTQRKAAQGEAEKTIIEVWEIN